MREKYEKKVLHFHNKNPHCWNNLIFNTVLGDCFRNINTALEHFKSYPINKLSESVLTRPVHPCNTKILNRHQYNGCLKSLLGLWKKNRLEARSV